MLKKSVPALIVIAVYVIAGCTLCNGQTGQGPHVNEFYRIATSEFNKGGDGSEAKRYLRELPRSEQLSVAREATAHSDLRVRKLGVVLLIEMEHADLAVPALAAMVSEGDDLKAFGYYWAHTDDPSLAVRMYIRICRHILTRFEDYQGEQRANVKRFLSDGGYANPFVDFSLSGAEDRLKTIESRLLHDEG